MGKIIDVIINRKVKNKFQQVKKLLQEGENPNELRSGATALFFASQFGEIKVVKLLLESGGNPNIVTESGNTPLGEVVNKILYEENEKFIEIAKALIEGGADLEYKREIWDRTYLMLATNRGNLELVNILIAGGANINTKHSSGETALDIAKKNNSAGIFELLEKFSPISGVDEKDFIAAAKNGDIGKFKELLNTGANPNAKTPNELSILMVAAENAQVEIVDLLINSGAEINYLEPQLGQTVLIRTIANAFRKIELCKENKNVFSQKYDNLIKIIQSLVKAGVNLNAKDESYQKRTALRYTIDEMWHGRINDIKALKILVEGGANLNIQDKRGRTTLFEVYSTLHKVNYFEEVIDLLLVHSPNLNLMDHDGHPLLLLAVIYGNAKDVHKLIANGADPNLGEYPILSRALYNEDIDMVKILIKNGADLKAKNVHGQTLLECAKEIGNHELIKIIKNPPIKSNQNISKTSIKSSKVNTNLGSRKKRWQIWK